MTRHPHTQAQLEAEEVQTRDFAADAVMTDRTKGSPAASLLRYIMDRDTIRLGHQRERVNFSGSEGANVEPVVHAQERSFDANAGKVESEVCQSLFVD